MSDVNPNQRPFHVLWVELKTRISSQNLHLRSGLEETAAESIYSLFKTVRELMSNNQEATEFQFVADWFLNSMLRPYTARWHGWMTQDKALRDEKGKPILQFKDEWVRRQFRRELLVLQSQVRGFVEELEFLRQGRPLRSWAKDRLATEVREQFRDDGDTLKACLGAPLNVDVPVEVDARQRRSGCVKPPGADAFKKVIEAEKQELLSRRTALNLENATDFKDAKGLAFSGGGIRSATFCLGITQVLARRRLLPEFDYLSTVSGGGYFGGFLSAYLGTGEKESQVEAPGEPLGRSVPELQARMTEGFGVVYTDPNASEGATASSPTDKTGTQSVEDAEDHTESRAIRHLRDRSRYLMDGELRDKVAQIGMVVAGLLFNLLIVLPVPILAALLVFGIQKSGFFGEFSWVGTGKQVFPKWESLGNITLCVLAAILALVTLAYPDIKRRATEQLRKTGTSVDLQKWTQYFVAFLGMSLLFLGLWCLPAAFRLYHWVWMNPPDWINSLLQKVGAEKAFLGLCLLGAAAIGYLASRRTVTTRGNGGNWWRVVAFLSGPSVCLFVFFATGYHLMMDPNQEFWVHQAWSPWAVGGIAAAMLLWAWVFVDVNTYSPHGYYRDRICDCYLQSRRKAPPQEANERPTVPVMAPRLRLQDLGSCPVAPYHLINTTLNLPNSGHHELRGRNGDFFVFSKHFSGSPLVGYHSTKDLEEIDPHLDLGTAVAVSGAAASSNMGWMTMDSLRIIMTLANIRLGYWLKNPALGRDVANKSLRPGPGYLFREMFARGMDERQKYLNLSDGGHIENLAAYELLRRRCKFIVCVDAGMEPGMECADLIRLERYAAIDFGIKMHYDLSDLVLQKNGFSQAYGVLVKIDYAPPSNEGYRKARKPKDAQWGWMLYLKLAMVGYGPGYVMDYKRQCPDFPHQTTADQLYDEAQFEAYRALGEAAAESFFTSEVIGSRQPKIIREWIEDLATHLLPDNDECFSTPR